MEMQHEPGSEKVAMMNGANTPVIKSLCLTDNPTVRRTQKTLLIILSICLVLSAISLITLPIFGMLTLPEETKIQQGVQIGQTLITILFYSFGIFIVYRYHQTGLRVFGWLCIICLILLGIAIVVLIIFYVITCIHMNNTNDAMAALASLAMILILLIIMCLTAFIVTVIIVKFTFKLAKLIDDNKPSITEHV